MNSADRMALEETLARARTNLEKDGFAVIIKPGPADVPAFLEGHIPDAIARRNGENVVIGIKPPSPSREDNDRVVYFAREVPKHAGWRFDLYVTRPRQETTDARLEPDKSELSNELEKVRKIAGEEDPKFALAYAWGLLEATARRLVLNERPGEAKRYRPASVVEALVSEGFIDDELGKELFELAALRNQIVHGFTKAAVTEAQVESLIVTIKSLVEEIPSDDR